MKSQRTRGLERKPNTYVKPSVVLSTLVLLLIVASSVPARCQMWDYLPLTKAELGMPFVLRRVETARHGSSVSLEIPAGPSGIHFEAVLPEGAMSTALASGKDAMGLGWLVDVPIYCQTPDFYIGDLDRDGITDLIILVPTCGNGLAPTVHLFALLFDKEGRPVPFEADGYFEGLPNGIDALVDMNHDGKAELVYMNFDDGYWITNLYKSDNGRWHRVEGQFAGRNYPLFTRFTNRPNKESVAPASNRHPFAPDLSNDTPVLAGHLTAFRIPEKVGANPELKVLSHDGLHVTCTPAYWYGAVRVVLEGPNGRQIIGFLRENKEKVSPILNRIVSGRLRVLLYGKRYRDRCSPEIIWATASE